MQDHPASTLQVESHPSKFSLLLSSHSSPRSMIPFPQVSVQDETAPGVAELSQVQPASITQLVQPSLGTLFPSLH